MTDMPLDIAFWNDRTRGLVDGSIKIDGVKAQYHTADRTRNLCGHDPAASL